MIPIKYFDHFEGLLIEEAIITNLYTLYSLAEQLKIRGYVLKYFNKEGIIVESIEFAGFTDSLSSLKIDLESIKKYMQELVGSRVVIIEQEIEDLKLIENNRSSNIENKNKKSTSFYLLFDHLPEHIKKELKIYIK